MGRLFRVLLLLDILLLIIFLIINNQKIRLSEGSLRENYIKCLDKKEDKVKGLCLQKLASNYLKNNSASQVEFVMKAIDNSSKRQWCHEFMHYIGWELYKKSGNLSDAFSEASNECDSAMYHGVVEEFISSKKIGNDLEKFINSIKNVCQDNFSSRRTSAGMKTLCYHGLGHGFMLITDNDLNESLKYCDHILNNNGDACYTGAFMENVQAKQMGNSSGHFSKFSYKQDDVNYPCNILDEKYKKQCYSYKGVWSVVRSQGDFKQAFKECLNIAQNFQEDCFWGVGSDIPGPHWSAKTASEKCKVALEVDPKAYEQCIFGAMSFVIQLTVGDPKGAIEFCDVVDQNYKDICYRAAGSSLGGWVTAEESLEKKCKHFKDIKAQRICQHPHLQ